MIHVPPCGHPFCSTPGWSLTRLRNALRAKGLPTKGKQKELVQRLHEAALAEEARAFLSQGNLPPPHQPCRLEPCTAVRAARSRARLCLYEPSSVADACTAYLALASRTWSLRRLHATSGLDGRGAKAAQPSGLLPQEAVEHVIAFLLRARRDSITLALRENPHGSSWEWQSEMLPGLVRQLLRAGAHPDHRPRSYNGNLVGRPTQIAILLEDCLFPGRATSVARFYRCFPERVLRDVVRALVDGGARANVRVEWCPGVAPELDTDLLGLLCAFGKYLQLAVFTELFDAGGDLNGSVKCFLRYYHHDDTAHAKLRMIFVRVLEHVKGTLEGRGRDRERSSAEEPEVGSSGGQQLVCPEMVAEVEALIREAKRARLGP